jgi:hypothetical protein
VGGGDGWGGVGCWGDRCAHRMSAVRLTGAPLDATDRMSL